LVIPFVVSDVVFFLFYLNSAGEIIMVKKMRYLVTAWLLKIVVIHLQF